MRLKNEDYKMYEEYERSVGREVFWVSFIVE